MKEKIFCFTMLLMLVMTSCSKVERVEYPGIASTTINSFLLDVQDSEGNSLIPNEEFVKDITFIQHDGYKFSGWLKDIEGEKFIESNFPLPLMSQMKFSDDETSGYGSQQLTILINGNKYELQGEFHYTTTVSDKEMYGGSLIKQSRLRTQIGINFCDYNRDFYKKLSLEEGFII